MRWIAIPLLAAWVAAAETPMDVQPVKPLVRGNSLGTCGYRPAAQEASYLKKVAPDEQVTGSFLQPYTLRGKKGKYVSWFGVVRGISAAGSKLSLLVEQKYFDGMTDCHIMLVSRSGGGDFRATIEAAPEQVPALALVRVYGTVTDETGQVPQVAADYIRVWPWLTFTFTDLGAEDRSNPRWVKYCSLCKSGRVYRPYPDEAYYFQVLGDPGDFGTRLKPQ